LSPFLETKHLKMLYILRRYLITLHRFFSKVLVFSNNAANTSLTVFALTIIFFLIWLESYTDLNIITGRLSMMIFGLIILISCFPILVWYYKNLPNGKEIYEEKDQYTGIILFIISIILFAFFRN
jgi:hypothetical protein